MEKDKKYNLEGVTLKKFFQEELETMETAKIKAVQEEKFLKQFKFVYGNNAYYRKCYS